MSKHYFAPIVALMLTLFTQSVSAFFDPPYITPGNPAIGDVVSVNIRGGECDSITGVPGYPIITRDGNAIRILFLGVHYDDPLLCTIPAGTATYPIGSFKTGNYTLQVDIHEPGGPATTLGTVPFAVTGLVEPPISTPTLTGLGVLVLLFGLIGLAAQKFRQPSLGCYWSPPSSCHRLDEHIRFQHLIEYRGPVERADSRPLRKA